MKKQSARQERNGDVVHMTSYAPLLAKEGHTQWNPDLIYFNNREEKYDFNSKDIYDTRPLKPVSYAHLHRQRPVLQ